MPPENHKIRVHLDELLGDDISLNWLSKKVGIDVGNLRKLKNGHASAIRFSTLTAICEVLKCQPGDLLSYEPAKKKQDVPES